MYVIFYFLYGYMWLIKIINSYPIFTDFNYTIPSLNVSWTSFNFNKISQI